MNDMQIKQISYNVAIKFLMKRHYAGRKPQISKGFGWFRNDELVAVCTFGKPGSPTLCFGVAGQENSLSVYELNRLCRIDDLKEPLSKFVSACLRILKEKNWIIVSYADTGMNHHGYIYQACNFIYTGCTKKRTDRYVSGNKHSRHNKSGVQSDYRQIRNSKHRYIYFCAKTKSQRKKWLKALNYTIKEYPKGDNKDYELGFVQQPEIYKSKTFQSPEKSNNLFDY